jgi:hypothetical protein
MYSYMQIKEFDPEYLENHQCKLIFASNIFSINQSVYLAEQTLILYQ